MPNQIRGSFDFKALHDRYMLLLQIFSEAMTHSLNEQKVDEAIINNALKFAKEELDQFLKKGK